MTPFTVLLGAYPVIDVAVVFVAVLLYWTSAGSSRSGCWP